MMHLEKFCVFLVLRRSAEPNSSLSIRIRISTVAPIILKVTRRIRTSSCLNRVTVAIVEGDQEIVAGTVHGIGGCVMGVVGVIGRLLGHIVKLPLMRESLVNRIRLPDLPIMVMGTEIWLFNGWVGQILSISITGIRWGGRAIKNRIEYQIFASKCHDSSHENE